VLNLVASTKPSNQAHHLTFLHLSNILSQTWQYKHTHFSTFSQNIKCFNIATNSTIKNFFNHQSPTLKPMELFHTPPTSPHPLLKTFENLSAKLSSPQSLSLFDTIAQMKIQQQPSEQLYDEPHQPSLVERLAYRYARPSIFPNDQGYTHLQSFVFHPIYKDLHGNPSGEPSLHHFDQQQQPQQKQPPQQKQLPPPQEPSQHFESLFSSYKKIEASQ
jgi:hypothetical protein